MLAVISVSFLKVFSYYLDKIVIPLPWLAKTIIFEVSKDPILNDLSSHSDTNKCVNKWEKSIAPLNDSRLTSFFLISFDQQNEFTAWKLKF